MRRFPDFLMSVIFLLVSYTALAQTPPHGIGRIPSDEEMQGWTYAVGPAGKELLPGKGTAKQGAAIYTQRCVFCHGPGGENGKYNNLKGLPKLPYVTSLWDYIHTSMPRSLVTLGIQEVQLTPDEVYALTAYILYLNGLVKEDDVLDNKNLPKIHMPYKVK